MQSVLTQKEQLDTQNGRPDGVSPPPVVTATDIARRFGEGDTAVDALRGVSLDVARGRLTAVMGPSGSGKSTLMHILAGLDRPTAGAVTIAGTDITRLHDTELTKLRRKHIGFVFQFFNLLPMLTARENVVLPLELAGTKPDRGWVDELTGKIGLTERLAHRPSELSGGQQQRVAIARALVNDPALILADEATGNLDSHTAAEILALFDVLHREGKTIVLVTHEPDIGARAQHLLRLKDGRVEEIVRDQVRGGGA
ncbi:MAG TPA: ABC transporter ATP-binding protein [Planctomycetota bacterium]|nr:ABC transporter ATP-binding protein [Planctomycetota bacterium]